MSKDDFQRLGELLKLGSANNKEKAEMLSLYRKYIDKDVVFCLSCRSSFTILVSRLKMLYIKNINTVENEK